MTLHPLIPDNLSLTVVYGTLPLGPLIANKCGLDLCWRPVDDDWINFAESSITITLKRAAPLLQFQKFTTPYVTSKSKTQCEDLSVDVGHVPLWNGQKIWIPCSDEQWICFMGGFPPPFHCNSSDFMPGFSGRLAWRQLWIYMRKSSMDSLFYVFVYGVWTVGHTSRGRKDDLLS